MLETIALQLLLKAAETREETSTVLLAERIGVSQQSVSRVLVELEREGLVEKRPLTHGLRIGLTERGRLALQELQSRIGGALNTPATTTLRGVVESGVGEGKYYLSLAGYRRPLAVLLGGEPFPGTFNVRADEEEKAHFLARLPRRELPGWQTKERTYGPVAFYPVRVAGHDCGLLMPLRTTHGPGKVELVATVSLRGLLTARDGDVIIIEARGHL